MSEYLILRAKFTLKQLLIILCIVSSSLCAQLLYAQDDMLQLKIRELSLNIIESYKNLVDTNSKIRIAVLDFENISETAKSRNIGESLSEIMVTELINNSFFEIVERKQLKNILEELQLNLSDVFDGANSKKIGKLLGADALLLGSISEIEQFFHINIRIVDVEKSSALAAASSRIKIKKGDLFLKTAEVKQDIRGRIQCNLDALDIAIHQFSYINSPKARRVVWPRALKDIVPQHLERIPDPGVGRWIYDPSTGKVKHSSYTEMLPSMVHPKLEPVFDAVNNAAVMSNMREIHMAIQMYMAENGTYPEKLADLTGYYLFEIPDAIDGEWVYDSSSGNLSHTKYKSREGRW
ncbi:FlgO family outer membrane protein [Elusimicrobiota bacterium]